MVAAQRKRQDEPACMVRAKRGSNVRPRIARKQRRVLVEQRLERDQEGVRSVRQQLAVQSVAAVGTDLEHDVQTARHVQ